MMPVIWEPEPYRRACRCEGSFAQRRSRWRVAHRNCNHSAFNGYRRTWSAYSAVTCLDCLATWRTRAVYVPQLPDMTAEEWRSRGVHASA